MSITVRVKANTPEALDSALVILKNRIKKSGLMEDMKRLECYTKPSEIKRRARKLAIKKLKEGEK
jgi:ribosomal protein S21